MVEIIIQTARKAVGDLVALVEGFRPPSHQTRSDSDGCVLLRRPSYKSEIRKLRRCHTEVKEFYLKSSKLAERNSSSSTQGLTYLK
uniref:Uncharacterized protein n=1 Tax=Setaria digitata TaxID=48799 RepID=A0A915Q7A1_9BILA